MGSTRFTAAVSFSRISGLGAFGNANVPSGFRARNNGISIERSVSNSGSDMHILMGVVAAFFVGIMYSFRDCLFQAISPLNGDTDSTFALSKWHKHFLGLVGRSRVNFLEHAHLASPY